MSGEPIRRPTSTAPGLRRLDTAGLDADAAWMRAAVEAFEPRMRELARRGAAPAAWEEAPGAGCGWTCRCCAPAGAGRRLDLDRWIGPGDRLRLVGRGNRAGRPLAARLSRARSQGGALVLGARQDPWGGDGGRRARTRALLSALEETDGLEIAVLTASPLVVCDLDLLVTLDAGHSLTVEISLATVEPSIAALLSAATHPPAEVLAAAGELAAQGLAVHLRLRPTMPGINDGDGGTAALLAAADAVGAVDVAASPLVLPWGASRHRFFAWMAAARPDLLADYRRLYRARTRLPVGERQAMAAAFARLHLAHGFPRPRPGRG